MAPKWPQKWTRHFGKITQNDEGQPGAHFVHKCAKSAKLCNFLHTGRNWAPNFDQIGPDSVKKLSRPKAAENATSDWPNLPKTANLAKPRNRPKMAILAKTAKKREAQMANLPFRKFRARANYANSGGQKSAFSLFFAIFAKAEKSAFCESAKALLALTLHEQPTKTVRVLVLPTSSSLSLPKKF